MALANRNGEKIVVKGKEYTIIGTVNRSYLVQSANGCKYKITPAMIERVANADSRLEVKDSLPTYFEKKRKMAEIFKREFDAPTKDNAVKWASYIYGDLSPENLTCDGELPRSQVQAKSRELYAALNYVCRLAGREITEEEADEYAMEEFKKIRK